VRGVSAETAGEARQGCDGMTDYYCNDKDGFWWDATNWTPYGVPGWGADPPMFMPWPEVSA